MFVDVNENGLFDANEPGIDGVLIELHDEFGDPVLDDLGDAIAATTSDGGFYLFEDLDPVITIRFGAFGSKHHVWEQ